MGNANGTERLAIAGAYLGWEDASGGSSQISTDPNSSSDPDKPVPHWRTAGDWEDDQLLLASLPTASDGPGYGYVDDLLARDSTVNNTIELLDDHFYEQHKELNPAFKALVSIAIGAIMPASLGTFGTAAASSMATDMVGGVLTGHFDLEKSLGSALFAGASAFATSAFDLGKIADASQDSLIGAPILTAGTPALLSPAALLDGVGDAFVTAGLTTTVYGGDFWANLRAGLGSFAANQALGGVQFGIGELGKGFDGQWEGSLGHMVLHGLAGCAFAEASGGDCAAGAVGGVSQSLYAGYLGRHGLVGQEYTQTAALIGGVAGYFASGGNGANVGLASTTARSGLQNNYLSHTDLANLNAELKACEDSAEDACDPEAIIENYRRISHQNDIDLINECGSDWVCMNDTLATMAPDSAWDDIRGDHWDVFSGLEDVIDPSQQVNEHMQAVLEGGMTRETREALYCGGISSPECDAILLQMDMETAPYFLGGLFAIEGANLATPYLAELCLATPSCVRALVAAEAAETVNDVVACADGDPLACAAATIPVVTTGGMGGKIDDVVEAVDDANGLRRLDKIHSNDVLDQNEIDRLARIREDLNLTSNRQNSRNVAFGEGSVDGIDIGEVVGVSGRRGPGVEMPENRIFTTTVDGHPRDLDSEVFVLEQIAQKLSPQSTGTIRLVSERTVCASCQGVITQFREKFPNINLIVIAGTR